MSAMSTDRMPQGVVFDCDGTIADTESLSDRAWTETLARYGYVPDPADFAAVIGHPFPQNWAYFSRHADLGDQAEFRRALRSRFIELFDRELEIHPDAVATIEELHRRRIPVAVASSSSHGHVDRVLDRAGVTGMIAAVVGADDVAQHKPDPEPYLLAAERLGLPPRDCTAVEDTAVGLASALTAGMFTVGIVRAHATEHDLADAHRVVRRLTLAALDPHAPEQPQPTGRSR